MKTFIDNTGLHRLFTCINKQGNAHQKLYRSDFIELLHFAENIMFSEKMLVSGFEIPEIQDTSKKTIELLNSIGCIAEGDSSKGALLEVIDFSTEMYANACNYAMEVILEDLDSILYSDLINVNKGAIRATMPNGIRSSSIYKWIKKDWNQDEKLSIQYSSLKMKAKGAYDYIVSSNDLIYLKLKEITSKIKNEQSKVMASQFLDVYFRVAINNELAKNQGSIYAPAPQRANIIAKSDQLFRYALLNKIIEEIKTTNSDIASKYLERLQNDEMLPIPLFALHFLRNEKFNSPQSLLYSARKLRDNIEVANFRKWLLKWEKLHDASGNSDEIKKEKDELNRIKKDIHLDLSDESSLFSILRLGNLLKGDFISAAPIFAKINNKLNTNKSTKRKIFLSTITKEFAFDKKIGREILGKLNRIIID